MARLLLAHSCDPNLQDREGRTALHIGAAMGHVGTLAALLEAGADPMVFDAQHNTCVHYAALEAREAAIAILLACPAARPALSHRTLSRSRARAMRGGALRPATRPTAVPCAPSGPPEAQGPRRAGRGASVRPPKPAKRVLPRRHRNLDELIPLHQSTGTGDGAPPPPPLLFHRPAPRLPVPPQPPPSLNLPHAPRLPHVHAHRAHRAARRSPHAASAVFSAAALVVAISTVMSGHALHRR